MFHRAPSHPNSSPMPSHAIPCHPIPSAFPHPPKNPSPSAHALFSLDSPSQANILSPSTTSSIPRAVLSSRTVDSSSSIEPAESSHAGRRTAASFLRRKPGGLISAATSPAFSPAPWLVQSLQPGACSRCCPPLAFWYALRWSSLFAACAGVSGPLFFAPPATRRIRLSPTSVVWDPKLTFASRTATAEGLQ